jgi:transcriptional regulator with XRE-family HTH domain
VPSAPSKLDQLFAAFLKKQRGDRTFAQFSKETGLNASTLFRIERGEQSITLGRLNAVMKRLNVSLEEVFGPAAKKRFSRRD